jgi:hypothetical protein
MQSARPSGPPTHAIQRHRLRPHTHKHNKRLKLPQLLPAELPAGMKNFLRHR